MLGSCRIFHWKILPRSKNLSHLLYPWSERTFGGIFRNLCVQRAWSLTSDLSRQIDIRVPALFHDLSTGSHWHSKNSGLIEQPKVKWVSPLLGYSQSTSHISVSFRKVPQISKYFSQIILFFMFLDHFVLLALDCGRPTDQFLVRFLPLGLTKLWNDRSAIDQHWRWHQESNSK